MRNFDKLNSLLRKLNLLFSDWCVRNLANWLHCRALKYHRIQFCLNHRKSKTGGVGIYLQNGLECKPPEGCKFSDPDVIESLFLEIIVPHGKKNIVHQQPCT